MQLVEHFDEFFCETVNLNQTRIDLLVERVESIERYLTGSEYGTQIIRFSAQGSWAHGTIIRPPDADAEFDADLVVFVERLDGWDANRYVIELRRVFRTSDRYRDMTSMKTRCVTINYVGDFHLDVVPIIVDDQYPNNLPRCWVCNRQENVFEETDGDGYAAWWRGQDAITNGNLRKVVRLLKYLRDIKSSFSVKSVLLTTLAGQQIVPGDQYQNAHFLIDVPTTLKLVIGRLDEWLEVRPDVPEIENPALPGETFTRNWDPEQYTNFREKIHQYRQWIDDAYDEADRDESIRKWRQLFGDKFAKGEAIERATSLMGRLFETVKSGQDLVAAVLAYGRSVLDRMPETLPHVEPSPYRIASAMIPARIVAHEKRRRGTANLRELQSGAVIEPNSGLEFRAVQGNGLPFPREHEVRWQVVNTDRAAAADDCLRGGFYDSDTHGYRWEATKYRGVHWIQAFVINRRTRRLAGKSGRYFVVIT
ncbi:MAG: nucleotidyltransferase [Rhodomicrobiaceae bacterium]